MGYYTDFELSINVGPHPVKEIAQYIYDRRHDEFYAIGWDVNKRDLNDNETYVDYTLYPCEAVKWYDHPIDMKAISEAFPEAVFVLHGEGEERDDIWEERYHGGRCTGHRTAQIIWPDWES